MTFIYLEYIAKYQFLMNQNTHLEVVLRFLLSEYLYNGVH